MMKEVQCSECNGKGYIPKCETWDYGNGLGGGRAWNESCQNCHGIGTVQQPVTNADHIRSMTDEELAKWLDEDVWNCTLCPEYDRLEGHSLLKEEHCDNQCLWHCLNWLKQPYKACKEEV